MRYDFHAHLHLDLDDWFRGERDWRTFWELKDGLPMGSKYKAALQDNEEHAAALLRLHPELAQPGKAGKGGIPLQGFTPEMALLARGLNHLIALLAALVGAQDPKFIDPPRTALDRVLEAGRSNGVHRGLAKVLPHQHQ